MTGSKNKVISSTKEIKVTDANKELEKSKQKSTTSLDNQPSTSTEIADFLKTVKTLKSDNKQGRLLFAMDATMSRQPTWDLAIALQGEMFSVVDKLSDLSVQLVYFRGLAECKASKWVSDANKLANLMSSVQCRAGRTKLNKVLKHAIKETKDEKVSAIVFIGDALEENIDELAHLACELKIYGVPLFMFQEGNDPHVKFAFKELAHITGGAYCPFSNSSAGELEALLKAVAAFASAGHRGLKELAKLGNKAAPNLLKQIEKSNI